MKKYIKKEEVNATPAWRVNGIVYPKDGAVPKSMNREDGYKVVFEDGSETYVPKEKFEKEYNLSDTFFDRLLIEDSELTAKYEKCSEFVDSDKFREVVKDDYPAFLLHLQCEAMGSYLGALHNRIEYANGAKTEPNTEYGFGEAIEALKFGLAIRRKGWNGKKLYVFKQIPAHIEGDIISKMQSLPQSAKDLILAGKGFIDYTSQCLIYNENTGRADSWVPSSSDVFAEDWEIVN